MRRILIVLALSLLACGEARAHAALIAASPADAAALARAPTELRLRFNEPVTPIAVTLIDGAGARVDLPAPRAENADVVVALPALVDGVYIASWRVTSADSHPVGGALMFAIGAGAAEALAGVAPPVAPDGGIWTAANVALRFAVTLAALLAAGGVLFDGLIAPVDARLRRSLARVALVGASLAALAIGARGALLGGFAASELATAAPWRLGLDTRFGASMVAAGAGLALIAGGWAMAAAPRAIATAGAAVALLSFALSGHAASATPVWLAAPSVALHVALAAYWIGAFLPLDAALARQPVAVAMVAVHRFSRLALHAVATLLLLGLVLVIVQTAGVAEPLESDYVRVVLLKLALVCGLLALAAANRMAHTPAIDRGEAGALGRLRRAIRFEIALGAAIVAVTAALSLTPPPRASQAAQAHAHAAATGTAFVLADPRLIATIEIEPARPGRNRILVALAAPDGAPLAAKELAVAFALPRSGIAGLRRPAAALGDGRFALDGPEFAVSGRWTLTLEILVTDFEQITLTTEVDIP